MAEEQEEGRRENRKKNKKERKFKRFIIESLINHTINHPWYGISTTYGNKLKRWKPNQVMVDVIADIKTNPKFPIEYRSPNSMTDETWIMRNSQIWEKR
jgi:hypothetical protein